jgi:putative ABC transport system permease protein
MSARAIATVASGGVTRRRTQTVVIFIVLLVSAASATIGLALLANSGGAFQQAFAAQNGADAVVQVNSAQATDAQLATTGRLPAVTEAAGPYPDVTASLELQLGGASSITVAGRASPGGRLDDLTLVSGQWARRPGQIVLSTDVPGKPAVGSTVSVAGAPGQLQLTVVGLAKSITDSAGGWVVPAELPALTAKGTPAGALMLYRFKNAATSTQLRADVAAVTAALPAGTVTGDTTWLTARDAANGTSSVIAPFVVAFALLGLVMSVLIVGNVVSGAVIASYRRIGVLKSLGFTPGQVVAAYVARIGVPALAGCVLGVVLGNLGAIPVLAKSATVYGVGSQSVPLWVDAVVLLGMTLLAGVAALLPSLRAGRLSAIAAISTGYAPRPGRGYLPHRLAGRLPLPRPVTLGLVAPFARPARTVITLAAVLFGATAVIFAVGLHSSLTRVVAGVNQSASAPVQIGFGQGGPPVTGPPGSSPPGGGHLPSASSEVQTDVAAIRAQPGTGRYVIAALPAIKVSGLAQPVATTAFDGSASWIGYKMITGHWYGAGGDADVNTAFLAQTGLSVGDTASLTVGQQPVRVHIVGEVFDPTGNDQPVLFASWQTLGGTAAGLTPEWIYIALKPGVSPGAYANALSNHLANSVVQVSSTSSVYLVAISLIALLTLMIAVVASLGVLNTVLLGTRERVHDLGVFRALGMTPRQTIAMVVCWVAVPAIGAAVIALPAGITLNSTVVRAMGSAGHTGIPASFLHVYSPAELILLAAAGLVIAALGALLPASWAAYSRTAVALRTE